MSQWPRVLLIEDDASLQRFVALALDEFQIELRVVADVNSALAELASEPVALILTDLMLPGRSGFELIDALADRPGLQGEARLVVFSAGLNPQTRQRLDRPQVWGLLSKPCSLAELECCVREALAPQARQSALPARPADDVATSVIHAHFGGNEALYLTFRASCLLQFRADLAEGDRALDAADAPTLRRLAHNLKSVLLTLGHADTSALARRLEDCCEHADWAGATALWRALCAQLATLH